MQAFPLRHGTSLYRPSPWDMGPHCAGLPLETWDLTVQAFPLGHGTSLYRPPARGIWWRSLEICSNLFTLALADLGGGVRDARPPLGVQILSISCSFRENLACSRPPWRVHAPPSGKSWIRHCLGSPSSMGTNIWWLQKHVRLASGWYASYWNDFLLLKCI